MVYKQFSENKTRAKHQQHSKPCTLRSSSLMLQTVHAVVHHVFKNTTRSSSANTQINVKYTTKNGYRNIRTNCSND
ncbi:hypothetical protein DICVIV_04251 [Dictyocaulus viviparus]|uniref:Uncharacterized protein n=1 Tax=Dictyocaulus viviparus TaxID=29172 RepID=A0A0D8Y4Z0_DICVI|nr:hypothetical protein DICVIV_04251 [Dictyocaulus viviparus]